MSVFGGFILRGVLDVNRSIAGPYLRDLTLKFVLTKMQFHEL